MKKSLIILILCLMAIPSLAETGTITVTDDKSYSYGMGGLDNSGTKAWGYVVFDTVNYTKLNDIKVENSTTVTIGFANDFESTRFSCNTGCTGGGWFYYQRGTPNTVKYVWDSSAVFPASTTHTVMLLDFVNNNVITNITTTDTALANTGASTNATRPACVKRDNPEDCVNFTYTTSVSTTTTDSYNVTYGEAGLFFVNVTKGTIPTIWSILDIIYNAYVTESTFNTVSKQFANDSYNGIRANVSIATGAFTLATINLTGASGFVPPVAPPTVDPITGVGIQFDQSDYAIGDIANITWLRTKSTPFGDTDYIVITRPDGTEEEIVSSPPDSGYVKVLMTTPGTWKVEFRRSSILFGISVLASDTAITNPDQPSYIYINSTVIVNQNFNITYFFGYNPGLDGIEIRFNRFSEDGTYHNVRTLTRNETDVPLVYQSEQKIITSQWLTGNYVLQLYDANKNAEVARAEFSVILAPGSNHEFNFTDPYLNVLNLKPIYLFGNFIEYEYRVPNAYIDIYAVSVVLHNFDNGQNYTGNGEFIVYDNAGGGSGIYITNGIHPSGNITLYLIAENSTQKLFLAKSQNFTVGYVDVNGNGLFLSKNKICPGETTTIQITVLSAKYLNFSYGTKEYVYQSFRINESTTLTYKFPTGMKPDTYFVRLQDTLGFDEMVLPLELTSSCVVAPTPPSQTMGGAEIINTLIFLATNTIVWTVAITLAIMAIVGGLTKPNAALPVIVSGWASLSIASFFGAFPLWIPIGMLLIAIGLIAAGVIKVFNTGGGGN